MSWFYGISGGEMVAPPPSYVTQVRREFMGVFSVFSREVGLTQEVGG